MANFREYERSTGMPGGTGGISGVANAIASSTENMKPESMPITEMIGNIGLDLAQNAANERARLAGIEDAQKNPGRKLLPPIGKADAEYVKAYKYENKQNIIFQANKMLNDLGNVAMKSPTASSLAQYDSNAKKGLTELLKNVDESERPELTREFMAAFDGNKAKIQKAVENHNAKVLEAQKSAQLFQRAENIQNFALDGDTQGSKVELENAIKAIDQGEELFKASMPGGISPDEAAIRKQKLIDLYLTSSTQAEAVKAIKEGRGEEFLREIRENRPEGITPLQHEKIVSETSQYLNSYNSSLKGSQYLTYMDIKSKIASGMLSNDELQQALPKMGNEYAAKINLELSEMQGKANRDNLISANMSQDFNNVLAMNKYTNNQKDAVFDKMVQLDMQNVQASGKEYDRPILRKANIAMGIKSKIPSFQNELESAIKYGSPEQYADASSAVKALEKNNPVSLDGFDKEARSASNLFNLYRLNTQYSAAEAAEKARNDVYNIDEETKQARVAKIKEWKDKFSYTDLSNLRSFIAEGIGAEEGWFTSRRVPDGLIQKFNTLLPTYVQRTSDVSLAAKELLQDFKNVYRDTDTNGRDEIMAKSPESVIDASSVFIQEDKLRALKELEKKNEIKREFARKNGEIMPLLMSILNPRIEKDKIYADINGEKRQVVIQSDDTTLLSPDMIPSWGLFFVDSNGVDVPIIDMSVPGGMARWKVDLKNLESYQIKQKEKRIEQAHEVIEREKQNFLLGD